MEEFSALDGVVGVWFRWRDDARDTTRLAFLIPSFFLGCEKLSTEVSPCDLARGCLAWLSAPTIGGSVSLGEEEYEPEFELGVGGHVADGELSGAALDVASLCGVPCRSVSGGHCGGSKSSPSASASTTIGK